MTREQIEKVVMEYLSENPRKRTGETLINLAIGIHNEALEDAASKASTPRAIQRHGDNHYMARQTCEWVAQEIRALKVK